jgi:WD40 repeat protein
MVIRTTHQDHITALAFHPCDRFLVSASLDGTFRLWTIATGFERARWTIQADKSHKYGITDLALSLDGHVLAVMGESTRKMEYDFRLPMFQHVTGCRDRCFSNHEIHKTHYAGVAISTASDRIALGGDAIQLFDADTLEQEGEALPDSECYLLAFLPDGHLLSAGQGENIDEWDLGSRTRVREHPRRHEMPPSALAVSADGTWLASADEKSILVRNLTRTGDPRELPGKYARTTALLCLPGKQELMSFHQSEEEIRPLRRWDLTTGTELSSWRPDSGTLNAVAVSQDGTRIATATVTTLRHHLIEVWDATGFWAET